MQKHCKSNGDEGKVFLEANEDTLKRQNPYTCRKFAYLILAVLAAKLIFDVYTSNVSQRLGKATDAPRDDEEFVQDRLSQFIQTMKGSKNNFFRYVKGPDLMLAIPPKSGSTSFYVWMYKSMKGGTHNCSTYIQNESSECWEGQLVGLSDMQKSDIIRAARAPQALRVAIWRDPFDRLVSGWKSKLACGWRYKIDSNDRIRMTPQLCEVAGLEPKLCLNITDFGDTLDALRSRLIAGQVQPEQINLHFRPLDYFFDVVKYDIVLTTEEMSNTTLLQKVVDRMKYKELAMEGIQRLHASMGAELLIPNRTASQIAAFAALTKGLSADQ